MAQHVLAPVRATPTHRPAPAPVPVPAGGATVEVAAPGRRAGATEFLLDAEALDPTTLAVVLVSGDPYTRKYDLDMAHEMVRAVAPGRLLVLSADPTEVEGATCWTLPGTAGAGDVAAALVGVMVAQVIALFSSVAIGCAPDNPFPGGSVNRVVKGVAIHPLEG